jgi:transposase
MPKPATKTEPNEVVARPENDRRQRRKFSRAEKMRIVEEAERSNEHGAIAAILRREGLYASQLASWREQVCSFSA